MNRKSILLGALVAGLLGFAAFSLSAQPPDSRPGDQSMRSWDHTGRIERIAEILDLSADQTEQWTEIVEEHQARSQIRRDEITDLRAQFDELAEQDPPDFDQLGRIALSIHGEMQASRREREEIRVDLGMLLTPDQAEKFETLHAAREFSGRRQGHLERHSRPTNTDD